MREPTNYTVEFCTIQDSSFLYFLQPLIVVVAAAAEHSCKKILIFTIRPFASNYNYKFPVTFYVANERNSIQLRFRPGLEGSIHKEKSSA